LEKNRLGDQIAVKTLLLLASLFFATCFCPPIRADDQIKDASPDGTEGSESFTIAFNAEHTVSIQLGILAGMLETN
jgi:hypothetical protein